MQQAHGILGDGTLAQPERARMMRLASYASVGAALLLIGAKVAAYLMTGSVALLSSMLDSLLDAGASLVNLYAIGHSLAPADREHRFGHGKAEPLAALGQAAFIAGSAAFLAFQAIGRLVTPVKVEHGEIGIAVMVFSIATTLMLVLYQRHVIRRTGSFAVRADSLHYVGDLFVNISVIVALLLAVWWGWNAADPLFAIGIAAYIMFTAWRIFRGALDMLMDRELPDEMRADIRKIALANPRVKSVHDLRTRAAGQAIFVQMHLEMDPDLPLRIAHEAADAVEVAVMAAFPGAEVIIHEDPAGVEEIRKSFERPAAAQGR
jgi:ferrous-iron efflux pump FieF